MRRLARRVRHALPLLQDSDIPTVRSWAELEIIGAAVFTILESDGITSGMDNGDVKPRRLLGDYMRLKSLQLQYEKELGMTPSARAALGLGVAKGRYYEDLASEMQAARRNGPDG